MAAANKHEQTMQKRYFDLAGDSDLTTWMTLDANTSTRLL